MSHSRGGTFGSPKAHTEVKFSELVGLGVRSYITDSPLRQAAVGFFLPRFTMDVTFLKFERGSSVVAIQSGLLEWKLGDASMTRRDWRAARH